jgi:hypothetical protein
MANFSAAQKREHAVLNKIQNELAFFQDRQSMTVAGSINSSVPHVFNLDAFELIDGDFDFTPGSQQPTTDAIHAASHAPVENHDSVNAGPDSLEWFSRLLQNAAARAS